jgi:inorganic pyrophosphatase
MEAMGDLLHLPARDGEGNVRMVVESPRGARVKLAYDRELDAFTLSRPLILGIAYPFDWGFVPSTRAPDGDPLDAMVLMDAQTFPGVVLACRPLGVVQIDQKKDADHPDERVRNDRLILVPVKAPRSDGVVDARQLGERVRTELAQFFLAAVALADKDVRVIGWDGPDAAQTLVDEAASRFK